MRVSKKLWALLLMLGVALVIASPSATGAPGDGITGSDHDFSTKAYTTEICNVCHTPHNAISGQTLLWNHTLSTATYTLYDSTTIDATDLGQPGGVSKLCLSCHDGTVAIDSFGGQTGTNFVGGSKDFGTDLSNDHPISFTYDGTLATADGELSTPVGDLVGEDATIKFPLFAGKLECATCHDVHNGAETKAGGLLRMANTNSTLCLNCHTK